MDCIKPFYSGYVARFGAPARIITDQGSQFCSDFFRAFCELLDAAKARTTPFRPSANGQVERTNRSAGQYLRCFINNKPSTWDLYIEDFAACVRSTVNRSTGYTPNMLFLGREIPAAIDLYVQWARLRRCSGPVL